MRGFRVGQRLFEPVADLEVRGRKSLQPFEISGALVPRLIDEIPVLAVLATQCEGTSTVRDAREMRVKETDRIEVVANGLRAMGANVETYEDGFAITGPTPLRATRIDARHDHRIAMTFAVAGLIAGPLGVAPAAEIVDVRVYDGVDTDEGKRLTPGRLAAGLKWVYENAKRYDIKVANVSLVVTKSSRLERWVQRVRDRGVLVVAAAGNRPQQGDPFDDEFADDTAAPDEDAVKILYPTTYDEVISASTTADGSGSADVTEFVVKNSNTTVAVPTWDAISYGIDGRPCVIEPAATSWAAAEVSGVLALLWQMYPDDTASQIEARLVETANGTPDDRNPLTGAGVVQPSEALTRPLDPSRSGRVERPTVAEGDTAPAVAPEPREDLLAGTRDDAVWWGLIGGGLLVVALLLRPVLARRRS